MRVLLFMGAGDFWAETLPAGLSEIGCEVWQFYAGEGPARAEALTGLLAGLRPDFVLTVGWGRAHVPDWLGALRAACRETGTLHVYWAVEDMTHHWRWSLPYVERVAADLVLTINPRCLPSYRRLGIPARFLTFGCNPAVHSPGQPEPAYQCDVALVANWYADKGDSFRQRSLQELLMPLAGGPYDVRIWGSGWDRMPGDYSLPFPQQWLQGPVPYMDAARVYRSARLVLAPQNELLEASQVTQRTMEILGCGACVLTSDTAGVRRFFRPGVHLLATSGPEQTRHLVDQYLACPEDRAKIAGAGREEVLARHTYHQRAEQLLRWVRQLRSGGLAIPSTVMR